MISISLCMIVKNEEDCIDRCLNSVHDIVDEIIIVDTGSTDDTKEIVRKYTDHVLDFKWVDDFAAARNFAFRSATKDYIFWLDADDILMEEDRKKFIDLKQSLDPSIDSVTMNYLLAFDEFGNVTSSVRRNRLVKRANKFRWIGSVHEYLEVWGNILNSDVAITHCSLHHDNDRNLRIYENRLLQGEEFSPRDLYYYANELVDHRMYEKAIRYYDQFLATGKGWVEDYISSCGKLSDCYHELGDQERSLESSLRSLQYDRPRPEYCCRIGSHFLHQNNIQTAIFWYKLATRLEQTSEHAGFINSVYSTWLPHLQLCVCYDKIAEYELAYRHNEIARTYRPTDASVLHNKEYLESILKINEEGEADGQPLEDKSS